MIIKRKTTFIMMLWRHGVYGIITEVFMYINCGHLSCNERTLLTSSKEYVQEIKLQIEFLNHCFALRILNKSEQIRLFGNFYQTQ